MVRGSMLCGLPGLVAVQLILAPAASPVRAQEPYGTGPGAFGDAPAQPAPAPGAEAEGGANDDADDGEASRLEHARSLFDEGLTLVESQQWEQAALRFEEVLRIRFSAVVAYNLASTLVHLGRLVEAADLLRPIAQDGTSDEVTEVARQLLLEVEPRIATLTVRLTGDTTGVRLIIGPHEVDPAHHGRPLQVDPGVIDVRVERDGAVAASRWIHLGDAYPLHADVTVDVPPDPRRVPPPAQVAAQARPRMPAPDGALRDDGTITESPWFWLAGAGAVAAVTVAVVVLAGSGDRVAGDPVEGDAGLVAGRVMPLP